MVCFRDLILLLYCGALVVPSLGQWVFQQPFPKVFQYDLGDPMRIQEFFQYSPAEYGFTTVFLDKETLPVKSVNNSIGLNAVLYRSFWNKRVIVHIENGSGKGMAVLKELLTTLDRPDNIYRIPIVQGPHAKKPLVNVDEFLKNTGLWVAKIAFGISEGSPGNSTTEENSGSFMMEHGLNSTNATNSTSLKESASEEDQVVHMKDDTNPTEGTTTAPVKITEVTKPVGYSQAQIDELAMATHDYCYSVNTPYYIALNGFLLSNAEDGVILNYYQRFMSCRLLLYGLPSKEPINVPRLRKLLVNQVNMNRMLIAMPGRDIAYRLYSLDNVAWSYSAGHAANWEEMATGDRALATFIDQHVRTYHLSPMLVQKRKELPEAFTFRPTTEQDHFRHNFKFDMLNYLAQSTDASNVVLLRPTEYEHLGQIMSVFGNNYRAFLDANVFRGPNAPDWERKNAEEYFKQVQDGGIKKEYKIIFSFGEGPGKEVYKQEDIDEILTHYEGNLKSYEGVRWGVLLEIGFITDKLDISKFTKQPNFEYLFLSAHSVNLTEKNNSKLREMEKWLPAFQNQIIILKFDDHNDQVNAMFQYFARKEPKDLSHVRPANTETPTSSWRTEPTKELTMGNVVVTHEWWPEPPARTDTVLAKSTASVVRGFLWMLSLGVGLMMRLL